MAVGVGGGGRGGAPPSAGCVPATAASQLSPPPITAMQSAIGPQPQTPPFLPPAQEAGMLAVRKNRYVILPKDFEKVGSGSGWRGCLVPLWMRCNHRAQCVRV